MSGLSAINFANIRKLLFETSSLQKLITQRQTQLINNQPLSQGWASDNSLRAVTLNNSTGVPPPLHNKFYSCTFDFLFDCE